jgi:hypothetical protein
MDRTSNRDNYIAMHCFIPNDCDCTGCLDAVCSRYILYQYWADGKGTYQSPLMLTNQKQNKRSTILFEQIYHTELSHLIQGLILNTDLPLAMRQFLGLGCYTSFLLVWSFGSGFSTGLDKKKN